MDDMKRRLSEYLFYEFGFDLEVQHGKPSEQWPFQLKYEGTIEADTYTEQVYSFEDDELYYALTGKALSFLPAGGMTLEDLRHQLIGSNWIASQKPVSLEQSMPGDVDVPSGLERRASLEDMARAAFPLSDSAVVLEGLYLRKKGGYLALVCGGDRTDTAVVSSTVKVEGVGFPELSSWRRLSVTVGRLIDEGGGIEVGNA